MRIVDLLNVTRRETPIFYRRVYTAQAVIESNGKQTEKNIEFTVEHRPLGGVDVQVEPLHGMDYPVIPVMRELKNYIFDLDKKGSLP